LLLALGFFAPGEAAARIHLDARPNHSAEEKLAPGFFDSELAFSRLAAALQAAQLQQAKSADGYDLPPGCSLAAESSAMRAGQVFEGNVLAAQNLAKNTGVWRPTAAQIDSSAFKVVVGDARYTRGGLPRGTILDSVEGGFLEIKGGRSILDSTYQLRLQTYRSLVENTPLTIQTTRPVSIEFGQWFTRWGGRIEAPPGVP